MDSFTEQRIKAAFAHFDGSPDADLEDERMELRRKEWEEALSVTRKHRPSKPDANKYLAAKAQFDSLSEQLSQLEDQLIASMRSKDRGRFTELANEIRDKNKYQDKIAEETHIAAIPKN